ncbi:MAG TPA: hypothetical protein VFU25_05110 [Ornithinibacter sp.]|nr:hypothetical protein [Ornithinibacter sp.]
MSHTASVRRTGSALGACALTALLLAAPAAALPDPGTGGRDFPGTPGTSAPPPPRPPVDDDALELMQVGAGLLAGIALAGAGAALVSRRHHGHPTPA